MMSERGVAHPESSGLGEKPDPGRGLAVLPQTRIHPHGIKHTTFTHTLARRGGRPDRIHHWADHNDPRTTERRGALDTSPAYGAAASMAELLAPEGDGA